MDCTSVYKNVNCCTSWRLPAHTCGAHYAWISCTTVRLYSRPVCVRLYCNLVLTNESSSKITFIWSSIGWQKKFWFGIILDSVCISSSIYVVFHTPLDVQILESMFCSFLAILQISQGSRALEEEKIKAYSTRLSWVATWAELGNSKHVMTISMAYGVVLLAFVMPGREK